jgi:hypothetical protein
LRYNMAMRHLRIPLAVAYLLASSTGCFGCSNNGPAVSQNPSATGTGSPAGTGTTTATVPGEPPPPAPISPEPPAGPGGPPRTYKVYVAGESIEARNQFTASPFTAAGARDDHGAAANSTTEFGWMVPFADRLKLRDPNITIEWVGSSGWAGVNDASYAGTYPTSVAPRTSALSGTSIPKWIDYPGNNELPTKKFCYDVALASRGGNDFVTTSDATFKTQMKQLLGMLAAGSSCRPKPLILVTAHMPDNRQDTMPDAAFVAAQTQRYKTRIEDAVNEFKAENPTALVRFIDGYSGFRFNYPTKSIPQPAWFNGTNWDFATMHRDGMHPLRLASIYAGETIANGVDLTEIRGLP